MEIQRPAFQMLKMIHRESAKTKMFEMVKDLTKFEYFCCSVAVSGFGLFASRFWVLQILVLVGGL